MSIACTEMLVFSELLPRLPTDGIFSVNALLRKGTQINQDGSYWQWQDDRGLWHLYTPIDSKIVEVGNIFNHVGYKSYFCCIRIVLSFITHY